MKFDIVEIGYHNIILGMPQLYEYNPQIDWIISLISTTGHRKNKSIPIKKNLTIENVYKEQDISKSI